MSDSLQPHGLQHARFPCPSPTPRVYSNSCPLSWCCHPAMSSSAIPFSCLQSFPASVFSNELALHIMWPKYWSLSFSISPSSEHSGLTSFRMALWVPSVKSRTRPVRFPSFKVDSPQVSPYLWLLFKGFTQLF